MIPLDHDGTRKRMKFRGAGMSSYRGMDLSVRAGNQDIVRRLFPLEHAPHNSGHLLRRFAPAEHHFREALAQGAVVIHLGESQIFEGKMAKAIERGIFRQAPSAYLAQNLPQALLIHGGTILPPPGVSTDSTGMAPPSRENGGETTSSPGRLERGSQPGRLKKVSMSGYRFVALPVLLLVITHVINAGLPWTMMRAAGLAVMVPAFVLWGLGHVQLGDSFSVKAEARQLVTAGIYSRFRNPIYLFGGVGFAGFVLAIQRPWFLLALVVIVPLQIVRSRREARVLEDKFGEAYREYRAKTWM
jgi:protein-S-isoprenylcysteine O-methyltransferase Ste14